MHVFDFELLSLETRNLNKENGNKEGTLIWIQSTWIPLGLLVCFVHKVCWKFLIQFIFAITLNLAFCIARDSD